MIWSFFILIIWTSLLYQFSTFPDYTAGELYDHFLAWFENGTLYTSMDHPPYRVLNYPPLFFIFTLGIHKIGFSILSSGRIVTILFFILGNWILFWWIRGLGVRGAALGIVALLGTSFPVFYNVGQWSLQWPAVTLSLLGLYFIQKSVVLVQAGTSQVHSGDSRQKHSGITLFLGAFFCALACFVKQTQIVASLIGFFWLFKYHRSKSFLFLLILLFTGSIGSLLLQFYFGNEIWRQMIAYTVGTFSFQELFKQLAFHVLPWILFFLLGLWIGFKNQEERKDLRWWYFIGTSISLLSSARLGAGHQYFLEWTVATLLWVGPWIANRIHRTDYKVLTAVSCQLSAILLLLQIFLADMGVAAILFHHLRKLERTEKQLPQICSSLGEAEVIPSGDPGLIRACRKIPALHPFIITNLANKKLWDQTPFLKEVSQGKYPSILLSFDLEKEIQGVHRERWTKEMIQAMRKNYQIKKEIGEWKIYQWKKS